MTLREKLAKRRAFTKKTMSGMTFGQKLGYLLTYYWEWLVGLLILALFIGYVADAAAQANKDIVLEGFFTNDEMNLFDAEKIEDEYSAYLGLSKDQAVIFDDDLYIDLGGEATEYTAASNGKLIAYMAVQELDFTVTTEAVLEHYEAETPMMNFAELLPEDMFEKLAPYLYEYTNSDGETKYIALDMSRSRFIAGEDAGGESFYMFIPLLAPHPENTCDFIRWCFPELF